MPIPSYTFVTSGGQRRFVHRWHFENNEVIECNKCGSTCKATDAYSKQWPQPKQTTVDNELDASMGTKPSAGQPSSASSFGRMTTLMGHKQVIVSKNIESFMLCDTKAVSDTQQFLLDAGITAIPDLLSAAAYAMAATNGAGHGVGQHLGVVVRFYVKIKDEMFMLQTSELAIKHHYDIRESVDMIFAMLLEKLRTFMDRLAYEQPVYTIQRMNIQVRRHRNHTHVQRHLTLPLQFARKQVVWQEDATKAAKPLPRTAPDLTLITAWFRKYLLIASETEDVPAPPFPCNVYCFQECSNSKELFAVPFHLSSQPSDILTTRSFVMLCDIFNNFLELQEIANIRRFLHHSAGDRVMTCPHCQMNFVEPSKMALHKALNCGHDFVILKMDLDFIEIYESCLLLEKCDNWSLFGIIE